jgi:hypothetical protein
MPLNELPSNFVNRSGVVGGWKDIPVNMNPADWEFDKNRAGRWFARPVDEMTGLDTSTRQQFTNFDNTTNANKTYLQSRADAAGANANADADAAAKRMASLGNLVSTGIGNPEIAGAQARLAVNSAALANSDAAAGVGLARDAAETRLANYTAARTAQREAGLSSARNAVQQAAVEQAKFSTSRRRTRRISLPACAVSRSGCCQTSFRSRGRTAGRSLPPTPTLRRRTRTTGRALRLRRRSSSSRHRSSPRRATLLLPRRSVKPPQQRSASRTRHAARLAPRSRR